MLQGTDGLGRGKSRALTPRMMASRRMSRTVGVWGLEKAIAWLDD
jgi:hypothetical protein